MVDVKERKKLWEGAALFHFYDEKDNPQTEVVVEPTNILAITEDQVKITIHRLLPEKCLEHLEDVDIIVNPF